MVANSNGRTPESETLSLRGKGSALKSKLVHHFSESENPVVESSEYVLNVGLSAAKVA